jgi:pullulanase
MRWFWHRPVISFYKPDADAIFLVVNGLQERWPMRKGAHGIWDLRVKIPAKVLHGHVYHFEVHCNGDIYELADPLAHRTQRRKQGLVSVFSDLEFGFKYSKFRAPPINQIVIYETHLPALSRNESTHVECESHRGTFVGVCSPAVLDYLQRLKVAVEFLPLHAHDEFLGQDWGYFSTSFNALRNSYAHDSHNINHEVMKMVDTLHSRGIPVLLDVVFNHGGELLLKAWGKEVVYRRHANGDFCHGSGCGPTIQTEHPRVRETILQTLEHLVERYRFDGFRFDLGALHDRETMLEIDRRLPSRIYLIAEPWALGGMQWGKGDMSRDFASARWAIWNDDFRESGRTFIQGLGDHHNRDRLMCAITGSNIKDGGWALRPQQSINYLSSHDGQTLADLVQGDKRRVFLGVMLVLTSQGIPMFGEGTEMMFSKQGHHNTYDRPDLNQLDWRNVIEHQDLVEAVARLIRLRKKLPHFHYTGPLRKNNHAGDRWDIDWIYPTGYPHHDNVNAIGYILRPPSRGVFWQRHHQKLVILLNGSDVWVDFHLPKGAWKVLVDGLQLAIKESGLSNLPHARGNYHTHPGTGVILAPA